MNALMIYILTSQVVVLLSLDGRMMRGIATGYHASLKKRGEKNNPTRAFFGAIGLSILMFILSPLLAIMLLLKVWLWLIDGRWPQ